MNLFASNYDMTVKYESKWFSDQQPDLSYFAQDEQRKAWGILLTLTNDHFQASTWSKNHENLHFLHASLSNKVPKSHFTF